MTLEALDREALKEHVEMRFKKLRAQRLEMDSRSEPQWGKELAFLYDYAFFCWFELDWFSAVLEERYDAKMIWDGESPYLLRIYLTEHRKDVKGVATKKEKRPSPFLHYFFRGDNDRDIHNHPFDWAVSLILKNGYIEHVWDEAKKKLLTKKRRAGMLNFIKNNTFHRVDMCRDNCWSLFIAGPKVDKPEGEGWGFLNERTGEFETYNERDEKNKVKWERERMARELGLS